MMNWNNVKLVFMREMRDQLRDRRTLFLIAVLPLLLYPLLGMSFFQLSQFMRHHAAQVLVVGAEQLEPIEWLPRLLDGDRFEPALFGTPEQVRNLELVGPQDLEDGKHETASATPRSKDAPSPDDDADVDAVVERARRALQRGDVEVIVLFPEGFGAGLQQARQAVLDRAADDTPAYPEPRVLYNSAKEKSQIAQLRVDKVLRQWQNLITQRNLADGDVPIEATRPFDLEPKDVASDSLRRSAVWSKVLPFVVLIWALTGAFYPAVDLCAGEKERGTLETLLTSPASRREIVWGKLLTVMSFSVVTSLLNLATLGLTAHFVVERLKSASIIPTDRMPMSMPSWSAIGMLMVALLPIAALFSALCLACAAFARSTKEGQYYLMPLMLVTMPLMLLPMSPGVELNLGNSLIPLTGLMLMLRSVFEGELIQTAWYIVPVMGMTLACCLLAIRWAEEQFNSESVLFRESERLELGRWVVHLVRDRKETPSLAQAALCMALIMIAQFFVSLAIQGPEDGVLNAAALAKAVLVPQLACILAPTLIMTLLLTRNPMRTLLLDRTPHFSHLIAAVLLALVLHPLSVGFSQLVQRLYPMAPEMLYQAEAMSQAFLGIAWWQAIALFAVLPACCEELAFRGFILSGLRHFGHKWWAIGLSAAAFGAVHIFLQQKINAAAIGLAIGYIAVQTGSLLPCVLFHAVHNGLQLTVGRLSGEASPKDVEGTWMQLVAGEQPILYQTPALVVCGVAAAIIFWRLSRISYQRTSEEQLQEDRGLQDGPLRRAGAAQP